MLHVQVYTGEWVHFQVVGIKNYHEVVLRRVSQEVKGLLSGPVGYLTPIGTGWEKRSNLHLIARVMHKAYLHDPDGGGHA